jgi:uncharacterized membrane protein YbaN (DUF454 family)
MQIFLLKIAGIFFVCLAGLGVVLPLLPTTPFLLVATACFAKSSPRFHQKLLDNKVFGPLITNWRETRSIPKKAKVIALLSIAVTMIYSSYFIENTYVKISFILFMMIPIIFIARLPLSELKLNSQQNAK